MSNQGTLFEIEKIEEKKSNNEKSKKGTIMELECMVEYIKKGYWVSKSMDPQCPFDFVAVKDKDNIILIDSKCASHRKDGTLINRVLKPYQKKLGVKLALRNFKK